MHPPKASRASGPKIKPFHRVVFHQGGRVAFERDAVLLGCAGMADLQRAIAEELGIPVVDGVAAAVKLAEGLVALGLRTSKAAGLNYPLPKPYAGAFGGYAPIDQATLRAAK
jgi:hypothetical protein